MSLRDGGFGELRVPLAWTAGVALIVAVIVAVTLLLTDRRETFQGEAYGATRKAADAVAGPVGGFFSAPVRWTGDAINGVESYFFAVSENRRLKAELQEMREWRDAAIALRDTNERYRTLLGLRTEPPVPMVAARIISDARGPFASTRLASAGKEKGVEPGNPVMSENGLVGRVIGTTNGVSRVLMLTDIASRTPVMIDRTNARAILSGDGGRNPKLDYLRGEAPVKEGDRVLTSGDGGLLPRGLPVGVAVKGLDGAWRVALSSDAAPIDYVQILLFKDFGQLANRSELDAPIPPPPLPPGMQPVLPVPPTVTAPGAASATAPGGPAPPPATPAPKTDVPAAKAAATPAAKSATTTPAAPAPKAATPTPATKAPTPATKAPTPAPKAATPAPKAAPTPAPKPAMPPVAPPPTAPQGAAQ